MMKYLYLIAQAIKPPSSLPRVSPNGVWIQKILQVVFVLAGAIAVIIVAIAGMNYVLSSGDPQKTAKAKDTILYAVIGLAISILSFSIVTFVIGKLFT